ncbi:sulfatase [bacterium]|nr:sulfatase [Rubripirellula sp.]MDC0317582.1 sulfatase [bacterium]
MCIRYPTRTAWFCAGIVLLASTVSRQSVAQRDKTANPIESKNVLFIAVDDLRVELGCYGQKHVRSPNIDKLASQGALFERAYCQQTVCNPSRASLLTGRSPDQLQVWDLPTHFRVHSPGVVTLPQLFKSHGYHTQCVGKIFHNWRQDEWKGDPVSWSVPSSLHYNSHGNDKPQVEGVLPPNLASGVGGTECRDVPDESYFDGRVAVSASRVLRECAARERPFFLAVGFWKPHTPFNAPKKYWDLYERSKIPLPRHLTPPRAVPQLAMTSARYRGGEDSDLLKEMHHGHLAAISYLDHQVGRLLKTLDELSLRKETVIVFFSDHGLHLGEHGLTRKTTVFELDAHIPLIIATPDQTEGKRVPGIAELLDLFPTLTELCGIPKPSGLAGTSLVPLLKNPDIAAKQFALTQTPRPNYPRGKPPVHMGYSIRTDELRYTEWRNFQTDQVVSRELYDHSRDPLETENIVGLQSETDNARMLADHLKRLVNSRR